MIGFYDYTVVLTYISLMCSVFGITQAIGGHYRTAIICLALSGLFDMFDGKIARTKKNRTDDEKLFGVQIDSLCDVVCFGVFPAVICYVLGVRGILGTIVLAYYCVCSVIRLGFFNVLETNRQRVEDVYKRQFCSSDNESRRRLWRLWTDGKGHKGKRLPGISFFCKREFKRKTSGSSA